MTRDEAAAQGARCDLCPLARQNPPLVPSSPNIEPLQLTIVGEGPGRTEEKLGQPFRGLSGKFLDERLRRDAHIPRAASYITNAALCRGESDRDNERAAECCAPRLLRELAPLPAEVPILALGKPAMKSLLGRKGILKGRGFIWAVPEIPIARIKAAKKDPLRQETLRGRASLSNRAVLPSLHPAFVLRADTWKPLSQIDFRRVGRLARNPNLQREDDASRETLIGGPEILSQLATDCVSLDIETDGIDPHSCNITLVQIADAHRVRLIWPWHDSYSQPLAAFLRACGSVVGWNLHGFDLIVLEAHGCSW